MKEDQNMQSKEVQIQVVEKDIKPYKGYSAHGIRLQFASEDLGSLKAEFDNILLSTNNLETNISPKLKTLFEQKLQSSIKQLEAILGGEGQQHETLAAQIMHYIKLQAEVVKEFDSVVVPFEEIASTSMDSLEIEKFMSLSKQINTFLDDQGVQSTNKLYSEATMKLNEMEAIYDDTIKAHFNDADEVYQLFSKIREHVQGSSVVREILQNKNLTSDMDGILSEKEKIMYADIDSILSEKEKSEHTSVFNERKLILAILDNVVALATCNDITIDFLNEASKTHGSNEEIQDLAKALRVKLPEEVKEPIGFFASLFLKVKNFFLTLIGMGEVKEEHMGGANPALLSHEPTMLSNSVLEDIAVKVEKNEEPLHFVSLEDIANISDDHVPASSLVSTEDNISMSDSEGYETTEEYEENLSTENSSLKDSKTKKDNDISSLSSEGYESDEVSEKLDDTSPIDKSISNLKEDITNIINAGRF